VTYFLGHHIAYDSVFANMQTQAEYRHLITGVVSAIQWRW